GALDAGCSFYAGYPITPASEIMEWMARELPKRGDIFIQMEDEIASLAAVIGASWAGAKAMTATSGPGFSLMQEHIGYAAITETPCVIVDCQRGGPSTGLPTLPSQGDVMQARWGSHGDRPAIVLTASSVLTTYEMTVTAFNFSEKYRVPVVLLLDAVISHMRENVELPDIEVVDRSKPTRDRDFQPFGSPYFEGFGEGKRKVVTGLSHDESGMPRTSEGSAAERLLKAGIDRINSNLDEIILFEEHRMKDARWMILSYGITSRPAKAAVQAFRDEEVPVGMVDLQTLWPFPEAMVGKWSKQVEGILVPELNLGQMVMPVRAAAGSATAVMPLNRADGALFKPAEIRSGMQSLMQRNGISTEKRMKKETE
ncbi:MAG: 2-oxoacid:acceptor oxidoreductase subunit alpha, partial [Balneolaceae bacterium]|nr:2-oxoacid:acceptor oxidoreductase subunit alpha [Balneolaceae bacterium]